MGSPCVVYIGSVRLWEGVAWAAAGRPGSRSCPRVPGRPNFGLFAFANPHNSDSEVSAVARGEPGALEPIKLDFSPGRRENGKSRFPVQRKISAAQRINCVTRRRKSHGECSAMAGEDRKVAASGIDDGVSPLRQPSQVGAVIFRVHPVGTQSWSRPQRGRAQLVGFDSVERAVPRHENVPGKSTLCLRERLAVDRRKVQQQVTPRLAGGLTRRQCEQRPAGRAGRASPLP